MSKRIARTALVAVAILCLGAWPTVNLGGGGPVDFCDKEPNKSALLCEDFEEPFSSCTDVGRTNIANQVWGVPDCADTTNPLSGLQSGMFASHTQGVRVQADYTDDFADCDDAQCMLKFEWEVTNVDSDASMLAPVRGRHAAAGVVNFRFQESTSSVSCWIDEDNGDNIVISAGTHYYVCLSYIFGGTDTATITLSTISNTDCATDVGTYVCTNPIVAETAVSQLRLGVVLDGGDHKLDNLVVFEGA